MCTQQAQPPRPALETRHKPSSKVPLPRVFYLVRKFRVEFICPEIALLTTKAVTPLLGVEGLRCHAVFLGFPPAMNILFLVLNNHNICLTLLVEPPLPNLIYSVTSVIVNVNIFKVTHFFRN